MALLKRKCPTKIRCQPLTDTQMAVKAVDKGRMRTEVGMSMLFIKRQDCIRFTVSTGPLPAEIVQVVQRLPSISIVE